jgi:linoleoyl-CoA desaturase
MSIYWFIGKDFGQLMRYDRKDLLRTQNKSLTGAMIELIINKTWYTIIFLVLPLIFIAIPWWQIVLGFLLMHYITGLSLALIFQPAHVIEETEFYTPDENESIENNWAIHQLKTTANFARNSWLFSWFIGGLNFQIEHHLFPNICHVHYRKISKIVKETALEFNLPYHEHKTFAAALKSHFTLLHQLGTGKYDERMAKQTA